MAITAPGDTNGRRPIVVLLYRVMKRLAAAVLPLVVAAFAPGARADAACWSRGELRALFGDYEIVDAVRYRGGVTPEAVARASIGERVVLKKRRFQRAGESLSKPGYATTCDPAASEGDVPDPAQRRSDFHGLRPGGQTTRLIEVRDANALTAAPRLVLEVVGDELWELRDGWLLKLRKRARDAAGRATAPPETNPSATNGSATKTSAAEPAPSLTKDEP